MRRCCTCKETKPYEEFSKNRCKKDGHKNQCKVCVKAYRKANKEKISEYRKAYDEANREKIAEYHKAYRKANREKTSELDSRKRARKRNAIPKFLRNCVTEKQRLRDIYRLRQVISTATGAEHHVDHMWPLSDGGPHWSGNLQIITAKENLSKQSSVCKETKKAIRESLKIARKEYNDNNRNGH